MKIQVTGISKTTGNLFYLTQDFNPRKTPIANAQAAFIQLIMRHKNIKFIFGGYSVKENGQ